MTWHRDCIQDFIVVYVSGPDPSNARKRSFHAYDVLFENFTSLISTLWALKMVIVRDRTFYDTNSRTISSYDL